MYLKTLKVCIFVTLYATFLLGLAIIAFETGYEVGKSDTTQTLTSQYEKKIERCHNFVKNDF